MADRKQIRQKDARTGRVYVYETGFAYDTAVKRTRLVGRRLVGHVDPDTGQVVANRPKKTRPAMPDAPRQAFCGATRLLDHVCEVTGLRQDLQKAVPDGWDKLLSLAYFLVCEDHSPVSRFPRWAATHRHPHGGSISSQRASELLASVGESEKEHLCRLQANRRSESEWWVYDSTSISTWSEELTLARWGLGGDHDLLPQVNLAVLFGETTGLPFHYRRLPGNIPDVSTITELISTMPFLDGAKPHLACDRGFYSKTNIDALMGAHIKFLIGLPARLTIYTDAITSHDTQLRSWTNWDDTREVFALKAPIEWDWHHDRVRAQAQHGVKRAYLHLFHSPSLAARDEQGFARLLAQLHRELDDNNRIEAHQNLYDKYFTTGRGGHAVGRDDQIAATRARHGHFILLTNDARLDPLDALDIYRRKDRVEKAFHTVKHQLDFRTPRIHNDQTLDGKLLLVYLGLTITSWLRKTMADTGLGKNFTLTELLDELDTIEDHTQPGHRPRTQETTKKQRDIYQKLGLTPPGAIAS